MLIQNPPVQITEKLWMFGTSEYPLYLLKGQGEGTLFEGGTGPMGPVLRDQLEQQAISTHFIKQVVIPHAHPDHVMAVPAFRKMFPKISVLASKAAADTLSNEKAMSFFCKIDAAITESLLKEGTITESHRPEPLAELRIDVDRIIGEGDVVTVDGSSYSVLETPGHGECSLSFHEVDEGILLVSDALPYCMPKHDGWWPCYFGDYAEYLNSMRRLKDLGAEILCPGHTAVVRGAGEVAAYFDKAISVTEELHLRIIDQTKAGKSVREIAEQLGSEIYEKTSLLPLDFYQKNCGLLVKQSLKHEGMSED